MENDIVKYDNNKLLEINESLELSEEFLVSNPLSFSAMKCDDETIRESMLAQFGAMIKLILKRTFGNQTIPDFKVRGSSEELRAFARSLDAEKNYMNTYIKHGLSDPSTLRSKRELEKWISQFEKKTGVKWPIK